MVRVVIVVVFVGIVVVIVIAAVIVVVVVVVIVDIVVVIVVAVIIVVVIVVVVVVVIVVVVVVIVVVVVVVIVVVVINYCGFERKWNKLFRTSKENRVCESGRLRGSLRRLSARMPKARTSVLAPASSWVLLMKVYAVFPAVIYALLN